MLYLGRGFNIVSWNIDVVELMLIPWILYLGHGFNFFIL